MIDVRHPMTTIRHEEFAFHVLLSDSGECLFLCITQKDFDQEVAFSYLSELKIQFEYEFEAELKAFVSHKSCLLPFELKRRFEPFMSHVAHRYTKALFEGFSFKTRTVGDTALVSLDEIDSDNDKLIGSVNSEREELLIDSSSKSANFGRSKREKSHDRLEDAKSSATSIGGTPSRSSITVFSKRNSADVSSDKKDGELDHPSSRTSVSGITNNGTSSSNGIVTIVLDPKLCPKLPLLVQYTNRVAAKKRIGNTSEPSHIPRIFQQHPYLMIGLVFLLGLLLLLYFVVVVPLCGYDFQLGDPDGKRICSFEQL